MRLKPRKKKARRLSYRKNWKSCSTARTKVRLPLPSLQPSSALRLLFEALPPARPCSVSVRLAFSCLAVVPSGQGDFLHLPLVDASLPFERYARPFGDHAQPSWVGPIFDSWYEAREQCHLQLRLLCRYSFWPGFPQWFACCCPDFRS